MDEQQFVKTFHLSKLRHQTNMENIFTASHSFYLLSKVLGVFPESYENLAKTEKLRNKLGNLCFSAVFFAAFLCDVLQAQLWKLRQKWFHNFENCLELFTNFWAYRYGLSTFSSSLETSENFELLKSTQWVWPETEANWSVCQLQEAQNSCLGCDFWYRYCNNYFLCDSACNLRLLETYWTIRHFRCCRLLLHKPIQAFLCNSADTCKFFGSRKVWAFKWFLEVSLKCLKILSWLRKSKLFKSNNAWAFRDANIFYITINVKRFKAAEKLHFELCDGIELINSTFSFNAIFVVLSSIVSWITS